MLSYNCNNVRIYINIQIKYYTHRTRLHRAIHHGPRTQTRERRYCSLWQITPIARRRTWVYILLYTYSWLTVWRAFKILFPISYVIIIIIIITYRRRGCGGRVSRETRVPQPGVKTKRMGTGGFEIRRIRFADETRQSRCTRMQYLCTYI